MLDKPLATATKTVGDRMEYDFVFSSPTSVIAGTKYAFTLSYTDGGGLPTQGIASYATSDVYASGSFFSQPSGSSSVSLDTSQDLYFKTYVAVTPMPVRLVSFTVKAIEKQAVLNWQTSLESNTNEFVISRSTNAHNFEIIGRARAIGNSTTLQSYRFVDESLNSLASTLYYRLRSVDLDGSYSDSPIIALRPQEAFVSLKAYPNPIISGGVVQLNGVFGIQDVQLADAWGRAVDIELSHPSEDQTALKLGFLSPGVYVLSVQGPGRRQTQKLVVN